MFNIQMGECKECFTSLGDLPPGTGLRDSARPTEQVPNPRASLARCATDLVPGREWLRLSQDVRPAGRSPACRCCCLAPQADAARRFTELGAGRGLDVNVAVSLLVDRDGLLWVGSREGLFRYDGYQATAFLPDPDRAGQHQRPGHSRAVRSRRWRVVGVHQHRRPQSSRPTDGQFHAVSPRLEESALAERREHLRCRRGRRGTSLGGDTERPQPARRGRPQLSCAISTRATTRTASRRTGSMRCTVECRGGCGSARSGAASTGGTARAAGSSISRSRSWRAAPARSTTSLQSTRRSMAGCGPARAKDWSYSTPRVARRRESTSPMTPASNRSSRRCTPISAGDCGSPRWRTAC